MEAQVEKDLLKRLHREVGHVTEEALDATKSVVTAVDQEVIVLKKGYLELIRVLSDKDQIV